MILGCCVSNENVQYELCPGKEAGCETCMPYGPRLWVATLVIIIIETEFGHTHTHNHSQCRVHLRTSVAAPQLSGCVK